MVDLIWLGIHVPEMTGGLAGGICSVIILSRFKPSQVVGSMILGALTANYVNVAALKLIGLAIPVSDAGSFSAFFTGLCATPILQYLYATVQRRTQGTSSSQGGDNAGS